jgi:hypothetical protein
MARADEKQVQRIEALVRRVEALPDSGAREDALQLMQCILDLHGSGIERMMEIVFASGPSGEALVRRLATDPLVANLLLLHGLHPDDLETRASQALAKFPHASQLLSVLDNVVHVRISGGSKESVEAMLRDTLPDAAAILVEETIQPGFVPLAALLTADSRLG